MNVSFCKKTNKPFPEKLLVIPIQRQAIHCVNVIRCEYLLTLEAIASISNLLKADRLAPLGDRTSTSFESSLLKLQQKTFTHLSNLLFII